MTRRQKQAARRRAGNVRGIVWLGMILVGILMLVFPGWLTPLNVASAQNADSFKPGENSVFLLQIDDEIISPITAEYIRKGIEDAAEQGAAAVVIQLDTPGGLLSSTHTIVKSILNSPVPVIVYVSPAGGRAGSAGVFITLAGHVAAMHPNSHIGAAHPVDAGGKWPPSSDPPVGDDGKKTDAGDVMDVMSEKILNDTVAAIRVLARSRDRNEDWAVRAVTESVSITADEALENNVVDVLAPSVTTLLEQADGRRVDVLGKTMTVSVANPQIVAYEFSARQQILSALAHPMLSYFLLMIGFYGIIFEVTHPGFGFSGIVGVICLILALLGMQAMSINFAGLGLIVIGMVMFVVEIFTPTFGVLFAGGLACLIFGTLMLYQTDEPYLAQVIPYAIITAVVVGALTGLLVWKTLRTLRKKSVGPLDKLIGQVGRVTLAIDPGKRGKVRVFGEIWDATANVRIEKDMEVRVESLEESLRLLSVVPVPTHSEASHPEKSSS